LDEVVGQDHLLGPDQVLRRLVARGRIPSMILWGPPGCGKTTLARLLAGSEVHFEPLLAVTAGVAELRRVVEAARQRRRTIDQQTLVFVDEIHRWSKAQQDSLLQAVEHGWIVLVGATTENPSFELNRALLSRLQVFILHAIADEAIEQLVRRALADSERGLGSSGVTIETDALRALTQSVHGDARRALNALEVAALRAGDRSAAAITVADVQDAIQQRTLLYDKAADEHYGVVSAFIKSMRGSDPDAAVYYLVRMLEAGEDPRFLLRRMVIFASEDVGNADPQALSVATAALQAYELVGLPEGVLPMTQAAIYLARAPKDNAVLRAYGAARRVVKERGSLPVPARLLNATSGLTRTLGHGQGYRYPHDFGGVVPGETYLPDALVGASIVPAPPPADDDD
jgi:putative ATPase